MFSVGATKTRDCLSATRLLSHVRKQRDCVAEIDMVGDWGDTKNVLNRFKKNKKKGRLENSNKIKEDREFKESKSRGEAKEEKERTAFGNRVDLLCHEMLFP